MNLFLGNNIDSLQAINLNNYIFLSLILLVVCIIYHKDWLKIILNQQLIPMQSKNYIQYFIFLFAVGLFSIVTVKINGVLLSIGTSILPVFIVKNFANTPNKMILYTIIFNILISLFSFIICSNLNINYNGFVVLTEFAIFILLSFLNVGCEKHC
jgi:ABC-type Mn2+/Zn2+ transport system permease subunit